MIPHLATAAVVVLAAAAPSAEADRAAILAVERDWNRAVAEKDFAALERILADDFILIWADGSVSNRTQVLANARANTWTIEPFETEEVVVRIYGDTAVVTGRFTQTASNGERRVTNSFRYTDVYRRKGATWVAVSAQATVIPKPAA